MLIEEVGIGALGGSAWFGAYGDDSSLVLLCLARGRVIRRQGEKGWGQADGQFQLLLVGIVNSLSAGERLWSLLPRPLGDDLSRFRSSRRAVVTVLFGSSSWQK